MTHIDDDNLPSLTLVCPICNNKKRKGEPYSDTTQGRQAFDRHVATCRPTSPSTATLAAVTEASVSRIFTEVGEPITLVYMAELLHISQDPFAPKVICPAIRKLRYCHMCKSFSTDNCLSPKKALAVDEKTRAAAEEFLADPAMLYRIKADIDKRYVGMDDTKLLSFILNCSCATPKDYTNQTVMGESSVGKSALMNATLDYVPPEWFEKVGRLTPTALDYLGDQDFKLLWIQEMRGAEGAAPSIRLSSSSDEGTEIWVTERGENGAFSTSKYEIPGRSFVTTTTEMTIHHEDATRSWLMSIDASERQTVSILTHIAEKAEYNDDLKEALGLLDTSITAVVQEAMRRVNFDVPVLIPYAKSIINEVCLSTKNVRIRRDFQKMLGLVKVVTLLFQRQRPILSVGEKTFVLATPRDLVIALRVGWLSLRDTMSGIDQRQREVLKAAVEMTNTGTGITCNTLGVKMNKSSEWARKQLKELIGLGEMDVDKTSKEHIYYLRSGEGVYQVQTSPNWTSLVSVALTGLYAFPDSLPTTPTGVQWVREINEDGSLIDPLTGDSIDISSIPPSWFGGHQTGQYAFPVSQVGKGEDHVGGEWSSKDPVVKDLEQVFEESQAMVKEGKAKPKARKKKKAPAPKPKPQGMDLTGFLQKVEVEKERPAMLKWLREHSSGVSFSPADKDLDRVFEAHSKGYIEEIKPGVWRLTDSGKEAIK
jgi:hypothetical protein